MVQLTVEGKKYSCFNEWKEMPSSKAVELATLCNKEMPLPLKSLYEIYSKSTGVDDVETKKKADEQFAKETDEDFIKNFPAFYGKVIKCLSDIPREVIDKILPESRSAFYSQYCFKFVFGVLHFPFDFVPKGISQFTHHEVTCHLPKSKTILGKVRPFADRTAIEFAEAADLELYSKQLDGGKFECAANIIAVLCRPMGINGIEPYNEDTCLKRAETFHDLKMDIVWEVFFCLTQQSILLAQDIALSSMEVGLNLLKQEFPAGLMTSAGVGR